MSSAICKHGALLVEPCDECGVVPIDSSQSGGEQELLPQMDWQQVALNGGPPCFALLDDEKGWYCGRAERWDGHDGDHDFVSLDQLLANTRSQPTTENK